MSIEQKRFQLFHAIVDPGSARARQRVVELELTDQVQFRNVAYPEVVADLTARGGQATPALWDGERLITGAEAVIARLDQVSGTDRSVQGG